MIKTIKIHVARVGCLTDAQKKSFIQLCGIMIDVGWIKFEGWNAECVHDCMKSAGIWHETATFTQQSDCETLATEQFLRGLAYATTQLVRAA